MHPDQLVAHRGYQKQYPENTLIAFQKAVDAGATFVETDIQFSADCVPMLYHDETLQRVSCVEGALRDFTSEQLQQISSHEPQRFGDHFIDEKISPLIRFVSWLQLNPHVTAYIELKEEGIAHLGRKQALEQLLICLQPVIEQVILISFDHASLILAK